MKGKVKFYIQRQGFGFIKPDDGSEDIFFHFSGILKEGYVPTQEEEVIYDVKDGKKKGPNGEALPNAYNIQSAPVEKATSA